MRIAFAGNEQEFQSLSSGTAGVEWIRTEQPEKLPSDADACILMQPSATVFSMSPDCMYLINNVAGSLSVYGNHPNIWRFNGWNGFMERTNWEIAGFEDERVQKIMNALGKKITWVPDEPGLIAARVIAMIINEAYYALGEKVSTKEEIDLAMKLGTNYPYGPFEWCNKIGIGNIYTLLQTLAATDNRYTPAPALINEATA